MLYYIILKSNYAVGMKRHRALSGSGGPGVVRPSTRPADVPVVPGSYTMASARCQGVHVQEMRFAGL